MKLTEKQLDLLNRRKLVVLATSSLNGRPRAILVEVNKAEGDTIIITDNEMEVTRKNLLSNRNVFPLAFEEDYRYGCKVSGEARYYAGGEYFDFVKNSDANKNYSPKGAVVVTVKEVAEF